MQREEIDNAPDSNTYVKMQNDSYDSTYADGSEVPWTYFNTNHTINKLQGFWIDKEVVRGWTIQDSAWNNYHFGEVKYLNNDTETGLDFSGFTPIEAVLTGARWAWEIK